MRLLVAHHVTALCLGSQPENFSAPLAKHLPDKQHTLEAVTMGDGEVAIDSFQFYQPPEKE